MVKSLKKQLNRIAKLTSDQVEELKKQVVI